MGQPFSSFATGGTSVLTSLTLPNRDHHSHSSIATSHTADLSADAFYQTHQQIPPPKIRHDSLLNLLSNDGRPTGLGTSPQHIPIHDNNYNILLIGDVHGCLSELQTLVSTALETNQQKPFQAILLVGDLVNKGPDSISVIQFVRKQRGWFAVRGNHDHGALLAALGDLVQGSKAKYAWVKRRNKGEGGEEDEEMVLEDEDVQWLADLPYTIRIPERMAGMETIVVHAGLVPGVSLEQQRSADMMVMRNVQYHSETQSYRTLEVVEDDKDRTSLPWGEVWSGPEHVIFGHDAKRGLQEHEYATGLDTGVCYGKHLTGIILPSRTLVRVDAEAVHCPID